MCIYWKIGADFCSFLLLAYRSCIKVYARVTSLHVRTLAVCKDSDPGNYITGFKTLYHQPTQLYVSTKGGRIDLWDWQDGRRLKKWQLGSQILGLDAAPVLSGDEGPEIVYTIDHRDSNYRISAHFLQSDGDGSGVDLRTLFRSDDLISGVRVLANGRCIVAHSTDKLIIGVIKRKSTKSPISDLKQLHYAWHEVPTPEHIATVDAGVAEKSLKNGSSHDSCDQEFDVDVVIGCSQGSIYLYRSLLGAIHSVNGPHSANKIPHTHLHWHRDAVGAVKRSSGGDYLISGGSETVLVLWQLDTANKQVLPHLGAAIEAISLSEDGTSYAIRLADNSVMVTATPELEAKTNVPGILMAPQDPNFSTTGSIHAHGPPSSMGPAHRRPAVTASKRSPFSILLATPAAVSSAGPAPTSSASYLQTIDPSSVTQLSKQALTRTKITDRTTGPVGNVIDEPHVALIETSHNGEWLASVEEWAPPNSDLDPLGASQAEIAERRHRQSEIVLKFWSWQEASKSWELISKVEKPHASTSTDRYIPDFVMDLIADPSRIGFVTTGNNGMARVWRPKARHRGHLVVKGADAEPLTSWACWRSLALPGYEKHATHPHQNALRSALSPDSSLLAIAVHCEPPSPAEPSSLLHLINAEQNTLLATRPALFAGPVADLAILGRHLILLSSQLLVWDLVVDCPRYAIDLRAGALLRTHPRSFHLALDQRRGTFAIAVPASKPDRPAEGKRWSRRSAYQAVFSPNAPAPLCAVPLQRPVRALVAAEALRAFYTIDADAEVHRVQAPLAVSEARPVQEAEKASTPVITGLEQIYGKAVLRSKPTQKSSREGEGAESGSDVGMDDRKAPPSEGNGLRFVTQDDLRNIWGHYDPLHLPPMEKLFEQVATLLSGKHS